MRPALFGVLFLVSSLASIGLLQGAEGPFHHDGLLSSLQQDSRHGLSGSSGPGGTGGSTGTSPPKWGNLQRQAIDTNKQRLATLQRAIGGSAVNGRSLSSAQSHQVSAAAAAAIASAIASMQRDKPSPVPPVQTLLTRHTRVLHHDRSVPTKASYQVSVSSSRSGRSFPQRVPEPNTSPVSNQRRPAHHTTPKITRTKYRYSSTTSSTRASHTTRAFRPSRVVNSREAPVFTGYFDTSMSQEPQALAHADTPEVVKTPITVTSLVPIVKTFYLRHGFRTSEAVVTTSSLSTSVINPSEYELSFHPSNTLITLTILGKTTDVHEPTKVTHLLVTTATLKQIKLVPIKLGYSTRTNTVTSEQVVTTLTSTIFTSFANKIPFSLVPLTLASDNPYFNVRTTTTTIESQVAITSTSLASIVFHGQTFVSTSTATSFSKTFITATLTHTFPVTQNAPPLAFSTPLAPSPVHATGSFITTLITFQLTNDRGEVNQIVTPVTVSLDPKTQRAAAAAGAAGRARRDIEPTTTRLTSSSSDLATSTSQLTAQLTTQLSSASPSPVVVSNSVPSSQSSSSSSSSSSLSLISTSFSSPSEPQLMTTPLADLIVFTTKGLPGDDDLAEPSSSSSPSKPSSPSESPPPTPSSSSYPTQSSSDGLTKNIIITKKSATTPKKPTKEDKYATSGFKQRKLHQFGGFSFNLQPQSSGQGSFFRDFGRLQSFPNSNLDTSGTLTAADFSEIDEAALAAAAQPSPQAQQPPLQQQPPPPQQQQPRQQFGSRPGSFQRIKLNGNGNPFNRLPVQPASSSSSAQPVQVVGLPQGPQPGVTAAGGFVPSGDNAPFTRFQRVVVQKLPDSSLRDTVSNLNRPLHGERGVGGHGFRRLPVFSNQLAPPLQPLTSPAVVLVDPVLDNRQPELSGFDQGLGSIGVPVSRQPGGGGGNNNPNRPFRRVRPTQGTSGSTQGGRRVRPVIRIRDRAPSSGPSNDLPSPPRVVSETFAPFTPIVTEAVATTTEPTYPSEPVTEFTTENPTTTRRVVRIRRPPTQALGGSNNAGGGGGGGGGRRRVVLRGRPTTSTTPKPSLLSVLSGGEPTDEERGGSNALESGTVDGNGLDGLLPNFGHRLKDEPINGSPQLSKVTPPLLEAPSGLLSLTYFTTFTYLTTVLRGPHTLITSRESVTSSVATQTLDSSVIDLLQNSGGHIPQPITRNLATRTKGPTTTIVNLASHVHVTNPELPQILATATAAPGPVSTASSPTTPLARKPLIEAPLEPHHHHRHHQAVINYKELVELPKSLYTQYTYFYTIIDGTNTRKSTRSEVLSTAAGPGLDLATLKIAPSINQDGFLSLGSGPETVHLGKRASGRGTTEVNLAMETFIKVDGISNVIVESIPTSVPDPVTSPTRPLPDSPFIESSFAPPPTTTGPSSNLVESTPELEVPSSQVVRVLSSRTLLTRTRRPVRVSSAAVVRDPLRSRITNANGRPVRFRVRPGSSRVPPSEAILTTSPFGGEDLISPTPSSTFSSAEEIELTSTLVTNLEGSVTEPTTPSDESIVVSNDGLVVTPSKKRVAVTVRRPYSGSRYRTRVRPGAVSGTSTDPKIVVVTRSQYQQPNEITDSTLTNNGPNNHAINRASLSSRFRLMSRVVKPRPSPSREQIEATLSPSGASGPSGHIEDIQAETDMKSILSVNEAGETVSIAVTTVPIIFGTETSYRTVAGRSTLTGLRASSTVAPAPVASTAPAGPGLPVVASPVVVTYYTTTTHTIPFTIGDKTLFTTFEITNSRVTTEPLPNLFENPITKTTKVSDGVTLIVASSSVQDSDVPVTLEPTLITGAPVTMGDNDGLSVAEQGINANSVTRTMFTTYTFFTTFYADDTSSVVSSEKVVSNLITIPASEATIVPSSTTIGSEQFTMSPSWPSSTPLPVIESSYVASVEPPKPVIVVETSERIETSTIYSTVTYYATLFNGTSSTITPIEETKTEVLTLREPYKVTRTLSPQDASRSTPASIFTRTYFTTRTNLVTNHQGDGRQAVTSTNEETLSNVITFTVPGFSLATPLPEAPVSAIYVTPSPQYTFTPDLATASYNWLESEHLLTTRTTHTTLTHYITLYSGASTLLSTIEEVSPTVVTERVGIKYTSSSQSPAQGANIERTREVQSDKSRDLMTGFVPSVSTFYTTHTYFTTLHSGLSSVVSSREEVVSSLVTLYVPQSQMNIVPSVTRSPGEVSATVVGSGSSSRPFWEDLASSAQRDREQSSLSSRAVSPPQTIRLESSRIINEAESSIISKAIDDLKSSKGLSDEEASLAFFGSSPGRSTRVSGDSTIIFFTDVVLNPSATGTSVQPTEAPGGGDKANTLLGDLDIAFLNNAAHRPSSGEGATEQPVIKDGSVIELSDLLSGSGKNFSGSLGAAIKDIVQLIAANKQGAGDGSGLPPNGGPVYVPPGGTTPSTTQKAPEELPAPVFQPDLAPVFTADSRNVQAAPSLESSIRSPQQPDQRSQVVSSAATPSLPSSRGVSSSVAGLPVNSKAIFSTVDGGATTIFFGDADESSDVSAFGSSAVPTRFVTSVESMTRTLTLTTTKVYYTRDSPLTITSVLTTVIPPKTFVSTIIGSRTILGTATEPTRATGPGTDPTEAPEGTTTVTTTTLIFNSITTTVVRTLVIPTNGIQPTKPTLRVPVTKSPSAPETRTRKPLSSVRKPTTTTAPSVAVAKGGGTTRKRPVYKPKPPVLPTLPSTGRGSGSGSGRPPLSDIESNRVKPPTRVIPVPILEDDQCTPACNVANKEVCKENGGKFKCDCRPGFARKEGSFECKEMQSYVLLVRLMKVGEDAVVYKPDLLNKLSSEFQKLAKLTTDEVDKAYGLTELKENYISSIVQGIGKPIDDDEGVLVNLTLRVTSADEGATLSEEYLRDELTKSFEEAAEALPSPAGITAEVEDVLDYDECSDSKYNDCSSAATCSNQVGSYTCSCKGAFADLEPSLPGRVCASEIKACDMCNGRGDCVRDDTADLTTCKCQRMYLGRYCEINGILLATLLPVAAILSIISVCCIVYCCRKYKKRTNISKGFRNIAAFGGPNNIGAGTLDRKAMLETSSENSDHYRSAGHVYDGPGQNLHLDPDSSGSTPRRRRGSGDPSMDRGMVGSSSAFSGMPPQVVIPRARHPNQFDNDESLTGRGEQVRRLSRPNSRSRGSRPTSRSGSLASDRGRHHGGHGDLLLSPSALPMPEAPVNRLPEPSATSRYRKNNGEKLIRPELRPSSRGSRMSYSGDLMQWPQEESASVYSRAASAVLAQQQASQKSRSSRYLHGPVPGKSERMGSRQSGYEWQNQPRGREPKNSRQGSRQGSERAFSPAASYAPGGAEQRIERQGRDYRAISEAGRSVDETIQFAPTRSYQRYTSERGSEVGVPSVVSRGYGKGWRNLPAHGDRAESEMSYATSFLTTPNRYQFAEDRVSMASRRSYFSNANWGHLPFYED